MVLRAMLATETGMRSGEGMRLVLRDALGLRGREPEQAQKEKEMKVWRGK
jgi:hypothetical protein